ncbi:DNA-directed RNA polymerase subunit 6 [Faustovirus]|nr:DNA-directed RNA polymerase subunit 6-like protein [Faustovirus]QJX71901.1 DNA-directed RNA polymerase subunit 6-like protein [Faustovirus]QJX72389.1 DNA-directed RNA polymerase subunit 6 [Faustovirus]QJX72899.1 DNA-directed RNA polymerase subunit 6 [Faustovirus]QJX73404.1 DNA-directed RNA polymerase subunit [Faustovirus]
MSDVEDDFIDEVEEEPADDDDLTDAENEGALPDTIDTFQEDTLNNNRNIAEIVVIPANERLMSDQLNKYETAEIINIRTYQISKDGIAFCDIEGLDNAVDIAKRELMRRQCPLMVRRESGRELSPDGKRVLIYVEDWNPNEMIFAAHFNV